MESVDHPLEGPKVASKHETKLSTLSPEALRVAAEITPTRLANLLIRKGPLAIRLITAQLSVEVPGFELLSLSKQRRLIMAAMEQEDPTNNVVFEKIGWGQWAVRKVDSDYIVTDNASAYPRVSVQELREKAKLGWLKKAEAGAEHVAADAPTATTHEAIERVYHEPVPHSSATRVHKPSNRRDSITNTKRNLHNTKLPNEKLDHSHGNELDSELDSDQSDDNDDMMEDMVSYDASVQSDPANPSNAAFRANLAHAHRLADIDDNAIAEDSDEDDDDDEEEEDSLFKFDDDEMSSGVTKQKFKRSPPLKFANRVPTKFSPPPALLGPRRKLSSATVNAVSKNTSFSSSTRQTIFSRSRLNSLENLDNYIVSSARNSAVSLSSPVPVAQTNSVTSSSPLGSWSSKAEPHPELYLTADQLTAAFGRRKLSFNESNIRSTLSNSLPRGHAGLKNNENGSQSNLAALLANVKSEPRMAVSHEDVASETDEEDWAAMGAETLRNHLTGLSSPAENGLKNEEKTAARALVDLMGN
ncbi:hypothetical protein PUMCH_004237 [Australozyma saopauloensis]|uniref:Sin3 binding protein n=1 Tax=Australozyma saopauloensis TaxID=291208 RepID=A0AAX4HF63_9ASCO|nr:hypothetical protein PUMCH_004237 [[Candida] saopauloensis]